jgi:hypothetical protein
MSDQVTIGKIYKAIPSIMKEMTFIAKDRKNTQQGYNFRGIDDVYNASHTIMANHGVFMITKIQEVTFAERPSKSGGILIDCRIRASYRFVADDSSFIETEVVGEGMDSGDKAANKAMSIGQKYAILQTFLIPTDDPKDSENDNPEPVPVHAPSPAPGQATRKELSEKGKEVRDDLGAMLLEMANNDKEQARQLLEKYSSFTDKDGNERHTSSLANMSEGWIKTTYGRVKKDYEAINVPPEDREPGDDF